MKALIVVDMQNDFIYGSLAVPGAHRILSPLSSIIRHAQTMGKYDYIIYTRDSHPEDHISFASTHKVKPFTQVNGQTVWPDHCIVGTKGWELYYSNEMADLIVDKAELKDKDAYSGFEGTNLDKFLKDHDIDEVDIAGLAFDFCVRATALDAKKNGYQTSVLKHLTASVFPENDMAVRSGLEEEGIKVIGHN